MQHVVFTSIDMDELRQMISDAVTQALKARTASAEPELSHSYDDVLLSYNQLQKDVFGGNISKQAIVRWIKQGHLPCKRIGRRVFFKRSEIEKAIDKHNRRMNK